VISSQRPNERATVAPAAAAAAAAETGQQQVHRLFGLSFFSSLAKRLAKKIFSKIMYLV